MQPITTPYWDLDSWINTDAYVNYTVQLLSKELKLTSTSRILDIGCGRGKIARSLAAYNHLVYPLEAIDVSGDFNENEAKENVKFSCSDAQTYLSQRAGHLYNGIIMKQMIHLIPAEQRPPLFDQLKKSLTKGGRALVLCMPSALSLPLFKKGKVTFYQEIFSQSDLLELAKTIGFQTLVTDFNFHVQISKHDYFQLLSQRFMSNLRGLSDDEIQEGLLELDALYPEAQLSFYDKLDVIHLVNV